MNISTSVPFRLRKYIFYKALEFYLLIFEGISTPNHVSVLEKRTFQARLSATILLFFSVETKMPLAVFRSYLNKLTYLIVQMTDVWIF